MQLLREQYIPNERLATMLRNGSAIVRRVRVNRNQVLRQAIEATNRYQYINEDALVDAPEQNIQFEEVDVYFFNLGRFVRADEIDENMLLLNLVPDLLAQIQVNQDVPSFADQRKNSTQWNRVGMTASYLAFSTWDGKRGIVCDRNDCGCDETWWFAGALGS